MLALVKSVKTDKYSQQRSTRAMKMLKRRKVSANVCLFFYLFLQNSSEVTHSVHDHTSIPRVNLNKFYFELFVFKSADQTTYVMTV